MTSLLGIALILVVGVLGMAALGAWLDHVRESLQQERLSRAFSRERRAWSAGTGEGGTHYGLFGPQMWCP